MNPGNFAAHRGSAGVAGGGACGVLEDASEGAFERPKFDIVCRSSGRIWIMHWWTNTCWECKSRKLSAHTETDRAGSWGVCVAGACVVVNHFADSQTSRVTA